MTIFNYTVNAFDVGIVALILITAIVGWNRGIAISIANFVRYSFGLFLCFYTSSNCSQFVYDNYVRQRCLDAINEKIAVSNNIDETINNLNEFVKNLPCGLAKFIDTKAIDISSGDIAESILVNVFEPIALLLIKIVLFIAVFLIFFGLTGMILNIIRRRARKKERERGSKSKLRTADKFFGMVFGVIKAFIIVLAISAILMYFINLDEKAINDSAVFQAAADSTLIHYISGINPFNAITEGLL